MIHTNYNRTSTSRNPRSTTNTTFCAGGVRACVCVFKDLIQALFSVPLFEIYIVYKQGDSYKQSLYYKYVNTFILLPGYFEHNTSGKGWAGTFLRPLEHEFCDSFSLLTH